MFVIHAPNVHQGGGKTLLLALLQALETPITLYHDKRFSSLPKLPHGSTCVAVEPSILGRLKSELALSKCRDPDLKILCFGNLPPLFRTRGQIHVFLQNRYLAEPDLPLSEFGLKTRLRIFVERLWFRRARRGCRLIVQTETMAEKLKQNHDLVCRVLPFAPNNVIEHKTSRPHGEAKEYDYIYVASGEAHKNHYRLLEAWQLLGRQGHFPSLCLTLDPDAFPELVAEIVATSERDGLKITNLQIKGSDMPALYARARTLIYPSLFESFGLPLLEAEAAGLDIVAAERDYVRDISDPFESFDPLSPRSIARAVQRHRNVEVPLQCSVSAKEFIRSLIGRA